MDVFKEFDIVGIDCQACDNCNHPLLPLVLFRSRKPKTNSLFVQQIGLEGGMVYERLHASCWWRSIYYAQNFDMEGSLLTKQLGNIMGVLYDICIEVWSFGEDT